VVHWDGTVWSGSVVGTTNHLYGVSGSNSSDVWAVGALGTMLHWNGSTWSSVESGTTKDLKAISGRSATDAWAVGASARSSTGMEARGTASAAAETTSPEYWQEAMGGGRRRQRHHRSDGASSVAARLSAQASAALRLPPASISPTVTQRLRPWCLAK